MRALKFGAALLAVLLVQVLAVRLEPRFAAATDLFLVLAIYHAMGGQLEAALLGGAAAGLAADALAGGLYGLQGFADTLVAYGAAYGVRRFAVDRVHLVGLLFAVASMVQQAVLEVLSLGLMQAALEPSGWIPVRIATTAILGMLAHVGRRWLGRQLGRLRARRRTRLRL